MSDRSHSLSSSHEEEKIPIEELDVIQPRDPFANFEDNSDDYKECPENHDESSLLTHLPRSLDAKDNYFVLTNKESQQIQLVEKVVYRENQSGAEFVKQQNSL